MQRVLAVVAAVLVAAGALLLLRRDDTPAAESAPIEKLLREGRVDAARVELTSARPHMDAATADYAEGLILLAERKNAEAADVLAKAHAARPDDWRIADALSAADADAKRFDQALAVVEDYVARRPQDERGLALDARYRLDARFGKVDAAKALAALDRIDALPRRVAAEGDVTAVRDAELRKLRIDALLRLGRFVDALLQAKRETELAPRDAYGWFLVGEAARQVEPPRPEEAFDGYRRATHLAPGDRRFGEQFVLAVLSPNLVFQGSEKPLVAEALGVVDSLLLGARDDPALLILKARLLARLDDRSVEAANEIYFDLRKRELPKEMRLQVLRNQAALLYDFKQGGKPGEYLRDSYELLKEYVKEGGEIDDSLRDAWETLRAKFEAK